MLLTQCGEEFSVSAKTYVGTLAALGSFGSGMVRRTGQRRVYRVTARACARGELSGALAGACAVASRKDGKHNTVVCRWTRKVAGGLLDGRADHQGVNAHARGRHEQCGLSAWPDGDVKPGDHGAGSRGRTQRLCAQQQTRVRCPPLGRTGSTGRASFGNCGRCASPKSLHACCPLPRFCPFR